MPSGPSAPLILVRPRIYIGDTASIGPGKIDLLRYIGQSGSLSAAARTLDIPYKRAWFLVNNLNESLGQPVVSALTGGKGGGGMTLTPLGQRLIHSYDLLQTHLNEFAREELDAIHALLIDPSEI
ncbi:winged helix-turn-helix domain-containing protein [Dickeya fangzhongdai]|uniref:winged helix-turn-helix domain-containing protein n=1 Tax=Dickeya fangzhongdai TaxID=1778540 RepID=UPI000907C3E7|nr:LysR family transcriptional regulator [Dickeya fangzhongdai]